MSQFEGLLSDLDRIALENRYQSTLVRLGRTNAANLAEKHALRSAVSRFDPAHPLLVDVSLREGIHEQAESDYSRRENWDSVAKLGANYAYSYKQPSKTYAALEADNEGLREELARMREVALSWKNHSETIEEINVQNYAEKLVLRAAIDKMAPRHPLAAYHSLVVSALHKQSLTAFADAQQDDPNKSYVAIAEVAKNFDFNKLEYNVLPKKRFEHYPGEEKNLRDRLEFLTSPSVVALTERSHEFERQGD